METILNEVETRVRLLPVKKMYYLIKISLVSCADQCLQPEKQPRSVMNRD
jgi:hypothetical protein